MEQLVASPSISSVDAVAATVVDEATNPVALSELARNSPAIASSNEARCWQSSRPEVRMELRVRLSKRECHAQVLLSTSSVGTIRQSVGAWGWQLAQMSTSDGISSNIATFKCECRSFASCK